MIWTVGHSNRSIDDLAALLHEHGIARLVDIRRVPFSRRHPQFSSPALARSAEAAGLMYVHEPDLGGHREPRPDSPNGYWAEPALRGYADHMATGVFAAALARLIEEASARRTAILCAEADPARCHRQLTADALVAGNVAVEHILGAGSTRRHELHPAARREGAILVYPPPVPRQPRLF